MKKNSFQRRGAALIVVLSILVLVSGLVVGMAIAMRMERSASFYNLERLRADMIARQGVDYGKALIINSTATNRFWISGPGQIVASAPNTAWPISTNIDLSSGYTSNTNANTSADMNRYGFTGGDRLLNPKGTNFNMQWIYVTKDGGFSTGGAPNTNTVGRFAFWVDDESTRLDLSTADTRTINSVDWAKPSQIDLLAIPNISSSDVTTITARASQGSFNSPFEALGLTNNASPPLILSTNRFMLTHYTQDPDIDPWGRGRIMLTTSAASAYLKPSYINILKSSATNASPGYLNSLDTVFVNNTLAAIMGRLTETNWPYVGDATASFAKKYGNNGAAQLAVDIVEYVRSVESGVSNALPFVEPLVATLNATNIIYDPTLKVSGLTTNSIIGTTRRPTISELGVFVNPVPNPTNSMYDGTLYVEAYFPPFYGISAANLPATYMSSSINGSPQSISPSAGVDPGFVIFKQAVSISPQGGNRPTNLALRVALLKNSSDNVSDVLDVAPVSALPVNLMNYSVDATNVVEANIHTLEVRDPRVNKFAENWEDNGTNTLGRTNSRTSALMSAPPNQPAPDMDNMGNVSQISVQFPTNAVGRVGSVGELGFVNTGVALNMPWRSVHLQPDPNTKTNIVPDWALLDLFSAPVGNTNFVTGTNSVSGRINLNAVLPNANHFRTNVLMGLFSGTQVTSATAAASNVLVGTNLAQHGVRFSGSGSITNLPYPSVGQIAEIKGVADTGEASEQVIRQIASLATVRGNVFSVYSVGQALQVAKSGKVNITGEKMVRAIVERSYTSSGEAQYKIIYWSEIYP